MWGNIGVALLFIGVGLYLTLSPVKGEALAVRLVFFAGYLALSALYWFKAYRQYRTRRAI